MSVRITSVPDFIYEASWIHLYMDLEIWLIFKEVHAAIHRMLQILECHGMLNMGKNVSTFLARVLIHNSESWLSQGSLNATTSSLIFWVRIAGGCLRLQGLLSQWCRGFLQRAVLSKWCLGHDSLKVKITLSRMWEGKSKDMGKSITKLLIAMFGDYQQSTIQLFSGEG